MKIAVFHPGTQHSRQTALAMQQLGRLQFYATGLFDYPESALRRTARIFPAAARRRIKQELGRFSSPMLDPELVRSFPRYELPERILARAGLTSLAAKFDTAANDRFAQRVAGMAGREGPVALWGYDNSSLGAFADPRSADCPKILDRTIGDWRAWNAAVERIQDEHGDWLTPRVQRASQELISRSEAEYASADHIVCASPFVIESLQSHSADPAIGNKAHLLPYGFDERLFGAMEEPAIHSNHEPVRFLFAGQLSARKGIQHVLEAIRSFSPAEASLTCVGSTDVPDRMLVPYRERVDFRGSVARSEMPAIMRGHDVLLLPSYFEGSAVVMLEALACGLAVVSSPQAGLGPSPDSGLTIARPSTRLLGEAMEKLITDRDLLVSMRRSAIGDAASFNHEAYRGNIAAFLRNVGI